MYTRLRRSLALKLILASAIPSAAVLLLGLGALVAHASSVASHDPALAFVVLQRGAILGTLLSLTFAGIAIALAARHFLIKPVEQLQRVMARAELGDFLVRARVQGEDELGQLARSFNTMLAQITHMAAAELENRASAAQATRGAELQSELRELNAQLEAHIGEMELLLEVTKAVSGTLDLPSQLETLGHQLCARFGLDEFTVMLLEESSGELVVGAAAGNAPAGMRGLRLRLGDGISGQAAEKGQTVYVPDVALEPRHLRDERQRGEKGSFLAVPLRSKGRVVGVMNMKRKAVAAFTPQEVRLAEAIGLQVALAITNARLFQETLELSFTDALTGIPNRRHLLARVDEEQARALRFGDPVSVLMLDLDLFKAINDQHGHIVGDGVLRGVARALRGAVRAVDVVARYGGEEFCVLLPRSGKGEAVDVAERLRRTVASLPLPGSKAGVNLSVTISIGVATLGPDGDDLRAVIDKADAALYEAKRLGRNRVAEAPPASRATA